MNYPKLNEQRKALQKSAERAFRKRDMNQWHKLSNKCDKILGAIIQWKLDSIKRDNKNI